MGTSFGFFVGRRKMRFFGSFVLLVAFAVVVVSVLSVEGAEPGWGLRTDYEFDNCTGAGPGVERYLKNNTCIPTGSSSSNLYRFLGTGVEIVGCVDSNCSTCNPALPVLYNACFQGAIYAAGVAETALNETIQRTAVNYQYATSTTQCNFENAVVIIKLGCYAPGAKGTYQPHPPSPPASSPPPQVAPDPPPLQPPSSPPGSLLLSLSSALQQLSSASSSDREASAKREARSEREALAKR